MDIQHGLLSKLVLDEDIVRVVNARITPDFFTDDRYRRVYEYCLEHWQRYGTSPSKDVTKLAFPAYTWTPYAESLDFFIDRLRERRKKTILTDALSAAAGLLQTPNEPNAIDQMEETLHAALLQSRLETAPTLDSDVTESEMELDTLLLDRMDDPGYLRGISTGFKGVDHVTGGLQPEQFVCLIGLPKSLKSSTLLYMAMAVHRQGKVPFFIGFEMANNEQFDRLVSLQSGVGLTKIITGLISERERKLIMRKYRELAAMRPFIMSVDLDSAMTVNGIQAKVMEYLPDVVFIDGAYMMQSEMAKVEQGSAQALTDIARSLKRLAQHAKIPIVVTTQASITRSKGGQLNPYSAMYTQAWQQSADVLLGVERVEQDQDAVADVPIRLRVLNSRSGPRTDTVIMWDWTKGSVEELDREAMKKKSTDDDD